MSLLDIFRTKKPAMKPRGGSGRYHTHGFLELEELSGDAPERRDHREEQPEDEESEPESTHGGTSWSRTGPGSPRLGRLYLRQPPSAALQAALIAGKVPAGGDITHTVTLAVDGVVKATEIV